MFSLKVEGAADGSDPRSLAPEVVSNAGSADGLAAGASDALAVQGSRAALTSLPVSEARSNAMHPDLGTSNEGGTSRTPKAHVPIVACKVRICEGFEEFVECLFSAGCQCITVHGRTAP